MRKGQITIFMILGLVVLLSIVLVFWIAKSIKPQAPGAEVTADETLARTCLSRITKMALEGLKNDGVLTTSEGGPLPELETPYMYITSWPQGQDGYDLPLGVNNYFGLCDVDGPNALNRAHQVRACHTDVYHIRSDDLPVQEMLAYTIQTQMESCIEGQGTAEVIIQEDAVVVRWSNPDISHTELTNLHLAWLAIQEAIQRDVSEKDFAFGTTSLSCQGCGAVTFQEMDASQKSDARPWDIWSVRVGGSEVARILLENRRLTYEYPDQTLSYSLDQWPCQSYRCVVEKFWSFDEDQLLLLPEYLKTTTQCQITSCDNSSHNGPIPCDGTVNLHPDPTSPSAYDLVVTDGCYLTPMPFAITDNVQSLQAPPGTGTPARRLQRGCVCG